MICNEEGLTAQTLWLSQAVLAVPPGRRALGVHARRGLQLAHLQLALLRTLAAVSSPRQCLDIGCFTGYAASRLYPPLDKIKPIRLDEELNVLLDAFD